MTGPVRPQYRLERPESSPHRALETCRNRLLMMGALGALAFLFIAGRLVDLTLMREGYEPNLAQAPGLENLRTERADILDRNGVLLATSLATASLYANATQVQNIEEALSALQTALPDLDLAVTRERLSSKKGFVWVRRNLTPRQQYEVNRLGIPGLYFQREESRVYPQGRLASHVLGYTGIDNDGLAGVERAMNDSLVTNKGPLRLSLDIRAQYVLHEELAAAMVKFKAIGAAGVLMDARSGEVLSLVSLPDFDPNQPSTLNEETGFNRVTQGVYEMGSTFKLFTAAMALESGKATLADGYDATDPIRIARFTISDYHAQKRWLSLPEIIVYSSNIGAAKMALDVGGAFQKKFLERLGLFTPASIELPEVGKPLVPATWREINTMTVAFGHGLSISPLQLAGGVASLVNGGWLRSPTLRPHEGINAGKDAAETATEEPPRIISQKTSDDMRRLMRLVVTDGTGKQAQARGYLVGGKTGSAEKPKNGSYATKALLSSFVSAWPMNDPRYVLFVMLDEPQGNDATNGYATGGWVAAPAAGRIIARLGPLFGVAPVDEDAPDIRGAMAVTIKSRGPNLASF